MDAEAYLNSTGWHQDSDGLWNNPSEKKQGRKVPDLVSALEIKKMTDEITRLNNQLNPP